MSIARGGTSRSRTSRRLSQTRRIAPPRRKKPRIVPVPDDIPWTSLRSLTAMTVSALPPRRRRWPARPRSSSRGDCSGRRPPSSVAVRPPIGGFAMRFRRASPSAPPEILQYPAVTAPVPVSRIFKSSFAAPPVESDGRIVRTTHPSCPRPSPPPDTTSSDFDFRHELSWPFLSRHPYAFLPLRQVWILYRS